MSTPIHDDPPVVEYANVGSVREELRRVRRERDAWRHIAKLLTEAMVRHLAECRKENV